MYCSAMASSSPSSSSSSKFWIFYGDDGGDDDDDGDDGPKSAFSNFVPYHQLSAIFGYFTIEYV